MGQLAAGAGIAKSVVYDHFPSKQALYIELLESHGRALIQHATRPVAGEAPGELMLRTTEAFFEWVEQHPFAWRTLFRDPPAEPEIAAAHARVMEEARLAIAAIFASAAVTPVPRGLTRAQTNEMLAEASKSANDGLARWWWSHREVPREAVVAIAVDLMWTGLERLTAGSGR